MNYEQLLQRIPTANGARDTAPTTAMRFVKVVVHNRPAMGQSINTHLRAGAVDQNDPVAVKASLLDYLADTASIARIMQSNTRASPANDNLATVITELQKSLQDALALKSDPVVHNDHLAIEHQHDERLALVSSKLTELAAQSSPAPTHP